MKTAVKIILAILVIIVISVFFTVRSVTNPSITRAYLSSFTGSVEVDDGFGWKPVVKSMDLGVDDKLKTSSGSTAVIIISESMIVHLLENSEGTISKIASDSASMKQTKGAMWNKFTGLVGMTSYEVNMPMTTATVRGTAFLTHMIFSNESVVVGDGTVRVSSGSEFFDVQEGYKSTKSPNASMVLTKHSIGEEGIVSVYASRDLEALKELRMHLIAKNQWFIDQMKQKYSLTDEQLLNYLNDIDRGILDDAQLIEKAPVKIEAMYRLKELNDKIKEQQKLVDSLKGVGLEGKLG